MNLQLYPGSAEKGRGRTILCGASHPACLVGVLAFLLASSTGCFAFARSVQVSFVCKPEAAREAGEEDALAGDPPRESYAAICGVAEPSLNRLYEEGYNGVGEDRRGTRTGFFSRLFR